MNKFDEAKVLVKMNERIESSSQEFSIDYRPMEDDLEPRKYAEYGYQKGQQELLLELIEKGVVNINQLYKLWD